MRVVLQPAYLLHIRPYRETSALADMFTQDFGRIGVVIKGARQLRSRYRGIRPFVPLLVSYQGKSDLFNLTDMEFLEGGCMLAGETLFCGFYLNELLIRLLLPQDPYPELFSEYQATIHMLSQEAKEMEPALRQFELSLLTALGYGFSLNQTEQQAPILEECYYLFDPKRGLVNSTILMPSTFKGEHLLNFSRQIWEDVETHVTAKRLMQAALAPLLGRRPLKTRIFFKEITQA